MDSDPESTSEKEDQQQPTTQAASHPTARPKGNGKVGKSNYTRDELLSLLAVMERILPIGTEEWEQVQMDHSKNYPGRDVESIHRKYNSLHRKQVPTGDPNFGSSKRLGTKPTSAAARMKTSTWRPALGQMVGKENKTINKKTKIEEFLCQLKEGLLLLPDNNVKVLQDRPDRLSLRLVCPASPTSSRIQTKRFCNCGGCR